MWPPRESRQFPRGRGDIDGSAVWKRVLAAVKEIQRQKPREGEAVN